MKLFKVTLATVITQIIIMVLHFVLHLFTELDITTEITISFAIVISLTYISALIFKSPLYQLAVAELITALFILIFENQGVYLYFYLTRGQSGILNFDIFTDAVFVIVEMTIVQFVTFLLARLTLFIVRKIRGKDDSEFLSTITAHSKRITELWNSRNAEELKAMFDENTAAFYDLSSQIERAFKIVQGNIISYDVTMRCQSDAGNEYIIKNILTDKGEKYEFYIMTDIKTESLFNIWIHYTVNGTEKNMLVGRNL